MALHTDDLTVEIGAARDKVLENPYLLANILSHVSPHDFSSIQRVNRSWQRLIFSFHAIRRQFWLEEQQLTTFYRKLDFAPSREGITPPKMVCGRHLSNYHQEDFKPQMRLEYDIRIFTKGPHGIIFKDPFFLDRISDERKISCDDMFLTQPPNPEGLVLGSVCYLGSAVSTVPARATVGQVRAMLRMDRERRKNNILSEIADLEESLKGGSAPSRRLVQGTTMEDRLRKLQDLAEEKESRWGQPIAEIRDNSPISHFGEGKCDDCAGQKRPVWRIGEGGVWSIESQDASPDNQ
ncbi:hypothetical protein BDZ85DRAFT_252764 [Elsinoe ampelina]|uniref:F-box domain-containing protein n=1 Tax=Elsinoe ampelina TaxID=302913 RepID=A0A6A6G1L9_9PEZI|nr:hypothetical protein BDZ85DRAFT_252764 [Elsinoe ampelina]